MTELFGIEMDGKTVLDIGGYHGRLAAEALRSGAKSAIVLDNREWEQYGWDAPDPLPGVGYQEGDFLTDGEPADVVFCSNVIYHVHDPHAGLARLADLARENLMVRTSFVGDDQTAGDGWLLYPDGMGHPNGTVWCRPSVAGLRADLTRSGFEIMDELHADHPNDEVSFVCRRA